MAIDPNVQRVQSQIAANPQVQQALQWNRERGGRTLSGKPSRTHPGSRALMDAGIELPHDYRLTPEGELDRVGFMERNPWVSGALAAGGVVGGGALLSALTGMGAAGALSATTPSLSSATLAPTVSSALTAAPAVTGGTMAVLPSAALGLIPSTTAGFTGAGFAPAATSALAGGGGTTGSLLSALWNNRDRIRDASSLLTSAGSGASDERGTENAFAASQDRERNNIFRTQQQAALEALLAQERGTLDRAQLGITAPSARTRQSVLGSLLQNIQPVSVNVPDRVRGSLVSYEGGLSPALLNDLARQSGAELQNQAHSALVNRSDIPEPTNFQSGLLTPPNQTPYREAGAFESGMSGAGTIGSILSALLRDRNTGQPTGR
jgi:hypothetical protein